MTDYLIIAAIDINLRLPNMVRGKKGFDRVVWAFNNVLNHSVSWLFQDLKAQAGVPGPVTGFAPIERTVEIEVETIDGALVPAFPAATDDPEEMDTVELLEWLNLAFVCSPRIQQADRIDPYLSRYQVPDGSGEESSVQSLAKLHWHGFMTPTFITKILLAALKASKDQWFALSASSFDGQTYTILKDDVNIWTWEYMD